MQSYQSKIDQHVPPLNNEQPVKRKKQKDRQGDLTAGSISFKEFRIVFPFGIEQGGEDVTEINAHKSRTVLSAVGDSPRSSRPEKY